MRLLDIMTDRKIFVAGHNGLVGSEVSQEVVKKFGKNSLIVRDRENLDLTNQYQTFDFLNNCGADTVILCAAKVGGIIHNSTEPASFIYDNLQIQNNIIHGSKLAGIKKLLFLGSSCIYPRDSQQPIGENALLTGKLEKTNEAYAIAKISGIEMCKHYTKQYDLDYRSLMPSNLYGLRDNFSLSTSHVIPALIGKTIKAKIQNSDNLVLLGSGRPLREFLWVGDLAKACLHVETLKKEKFKKLTQGQQLLNIGSGEEVSIASLAQMIASIVGYKGKICFDNTSPDGTPRKILDSTKILSTGWQATTKLEQGLELVIRQQWKIINEQ